jgi:hypothetical protein
MSAPQKRSYRMTSHQSTQADLGGAAPAIARDIDPDEEPPEDLASDLTPYEQTPYEQTPCEQTPCEQTMESAASREVAASETPMATYLDSSVVEELTRRLPTSELVKIIKGALECGRRNLPFTESDLLRAMTFGSSSVPVRQARGTRSPRG